MDTPPVGKRVLGGAGFAVILATYLWIVLTQPHTLGIEQLSSTALIVMGGYLLGAVLVIAGALDVLTNRLLVLVPIAIVLDIVAGQLVGVSGIPLYLDSLGIVLVGVLAGPRAGAVTGALSSIVWGLTLNPTVIPFAAGAVVIGLSAGLAARAGAARRLWTFVLWGAGTGVVVGMLSAPVAAFVYGGGLGVGTGSLVAILQATGRSMLGATTLQSLLSDPLDKAIVFALILLAVRALPRRARDGYPLSEQLTRP